MARPIGSSTDGGGLLGNEQAPDMPRIRTHIARQHTANRQTRVLAVGTWLSPDVVPRFGCASRTWRGSGATESRTLCSTATWRLADLRPLHLLVPPCRVGRSLISLSQAAMSLGLRTSPDAVRKDIRRLKSCFPDLGIQPLHTPV